jgi:hypothetical protein
LIINIGEVNKYMNVCACVCVLFFINDTSKHHPAYIVVWFQMALNDEDMESSRACLVEQVYHQQLLCQTSARQNADWSLQRVHTQQQSTSRIGNVPQG